MRSDLDAPPTEMHTATRPADTPPANGGASSEDGGRGPLIAVAFAAFVTAVAIGWMLLGSRSGRSDAAESSDVEVAVAVVTDGTASEAGEPDDAARPLPAPDGDGDGSDASVTAPDEMFDDSAAAAPPPPPVVDAGTDAVAAGRDVPPAEFPEDGGLADEPAPVEAEPTGPPQSRAAFRDGQVILFGAVPSREVADEIFDLAASLLGPENVVDEYEIDPTVPAPTTGNLTVEETIEFSSGAAVLPDPAPAILPIGAALMTARPTTEMRIIGHTDGRGSEAANLSLSLERAEAVKAYFVEQGIDPARISAVGFGESFPVASDDTEEGRRQNRRIEFEVVNILGEG